MKFPNAPWDWLILCENTHISIGILDTYFKTEREEYLDIQWECIVEILGYPSVFEIIDTHLDKIDFDLTFGILTVEMVERYHKTINWEHLTEYVNDYSIPIEIFDIHSDLYGHLYDWSNLSACTTITLDFIKKHHLRLNFNELSENAALTSEWITEYHSRLNWDLLSVNSSITKEILAEYPHDIKWDKIDYTHLFINVIEYIIENTTDPSTLNWKKISTTLDLTPEFIEQFN
jgi:hypothetical protein